MLKVTKIANFDLAKLCKFDDKKYPFLLESVIHNAQNRYSILFAYPQKTITCKDDSFLQELEQNISQKKHIENTFDLPFLGGYFVYLSYEFAGYLEPSTLIHTTKQNHLLASATYIPTAIITDHSNNTTYIVDEYGDNINSVQEDIAKITKFNHINLQFEIVSEDENIYKKSVETTKKYIVAGDIFQANLSRKWQVNLQKNIKDIEIYNLLKKSNPAPFAAFAKFENFSIISSSPERLFSLKNGVVQTRPIAGTRPRNSDTLKDEELKKSLQNNLKEQAEHLMLLDLERNDLGRICEYGSVVADEIMVIESYEFVHHIVSNITGKLAKHKTFSDIIGALFPGGTITGCPKIRSIQIIDELEKSPREAYTGSLGYISNCGAMDFNILIRTMVKKGKDISFRAGGGIVFDSIAENEVEETNHKADGMLKVFV